MRRGTDRLNRGLLTLVGLLLVGLGASVLLRGSGAAPGAGRDPVVSSWLRDESRSRQVLLLSLLALAAVVLMGLGWSWLMAQLPKSRPVARVPLGSTEHTTHLEVSATALTEALSADVRRLGGVTDASARVVREQPLTIHLDVSLEEGTDLKGVTQAIAGRPRRHLEEALDLSEVELQVKLHLARRASRRVA